MSNTPRWQFGPLEDNQSENRGEKFYSGYLHSAGFGAWRGEPYAPTPLILPLTQCHSDITRYRPWSAIARGNYFDRAEPKNFQKLLRGPALLTFRHFGAHFEESFRLSKSSWMTDLNRSREIFSCSANDSAEIQLSSRISSWILTIISGVFTVLFCVFHDEAHHRWNCFEVEGKESFLQRHSS